MKRKMLQKVVALAAVLTMGMSALAGCGQAADGGTAAAETGEGGVRQQPRKKVYPKRLRQKTRRAWRIGKVNRLSLLPQ